MKGFKIREKPQIAIDVDGTLAKEKKEKSKLNLR
jgi:histidinol phosphatase-like enzyme